MSVFIIGEMGSTHDGDLNKAYRLIDLAKAAGCDAVKGQFWSNPDRLAARRHAESYVETYRRYQMPAAWLPRLAARCADVGIKFLCTTFLPEDVHVVAPYVEWFKISSFESSDYHFVRLHDEFRQPKLVSVGLHTAVEVQELRGILRAGDKILHCVSAYPVPAHQATLRGIRGNDGYSDHTRHELTGALAAAVGAKVLEVHFRLDETDDQNPDCVVSHRPDGLVRYVANVRLAEQMLGDGEKTIQEAERPLLRYRVTGW